MKNILRKLGNNSDLVRTMLGMRICICNEFPGDAITSGHKITLWARGSWYNKVYVAIQSSLGLKIPQDHFMRLEYKERLTLMCVCVYFSESSQQLAHMSVVLINFPFTLLQSYCCSLVAKLCATICNIMEYSSPGSSIHRLSQARMLEQVAISSCKGPSQPRDQTHVSCICRWILNH